MNGVCKYIPQTILKAYTFIFNTRLPTSFTQPTEGNFAQHTNLGRNLQNPTPSYITRHTDQRWLPPILLDIPSLHTSLSECLSIPKDLSVSLPPAEWHIYHNPSVIGSFQKACSVAVWAIICTGHSLHSTDIATRCLSWWLMAK